MTFLKTAERVSPKSRSDNYVFQRSLLVYKETARLISGNVLEIGTGSGYGIEEIAPAATEFWTLDKFYIHVNYQKHTNTRFIKNEVPPLLNMPDNYFDFVICFQVIEHIGKVEVLLNEIERVLKPGGKFIVSTPNVKMSLTRNPWHIKEYTYKDLKRLLSNNFIKIDVKGVFGDSQVRKYYSKNKNSVKRFQKFDIFRFNKILPRQLYKIPYDFMNRLNRVLIYNTNKELTSKIHIGNYYFDKANDECYDLFLIAHKANAS